MDIHFWEAVCFVIFIALIYKPLSKFIIKYLADYSNEIKLKILESEELRKEAEKAILYYKKRNEKLSDEIKEIYKNSNENIKKISESNKKYIEGKIEAKLLIHEEKLKINYQASINVIKKDILTKTLILVRQYLEDNKSKNLDSKCLNQVLDVTNNKKIRIQ